MQSRPFPSTAEALAFPSSAQASNCWVTFDTNGGTPVEPQQLPPGAKISKPPVQTRTGYTTDGNWYTDTTLVTAWDFDQTVSSDNITLYAKWIPIVYTISYTLNGGSGGDTPTTYTIETPAVILGTPSRSGYDFQGWYDNPELSGYPITAILQGSTGDKTFYAGWEVIPYTISYVLNGGENNPANQPEYNIESSPVPLHDAVRRGYTFEGWYDNASFTGNTVTGIPAGSYGDRTVYAKWRIIVYIISWTPNGGTVTPENPTTYTVESSEIVFTNPIRAGYAFQGWYDNSDFASLPVDSIPAGSIGDRAYYAGWNTHTYEIAYELNGGRNSAYNPPQYTIESSTIILEPPTLRGSAFLGWYNDPEFTDGPVTTIPHGSIGDITLYAGWEITVYPIEYVLSGGENNPENAAGYTIEDAVIIYPAERPGYSFAGWFDNAGFLNAPVSVIPQGTIGALKFFARWTKGVYFPTGREHIDRYGGDPMLF